MLSEVDELVLSGAEVLPLPGSPTDNSGTSLRSLSGFTDYTRN